MGSEALGDQNWEELIQRYNALVKACEAKHSHRKWWLHLEERTGPSKWFGVSFDRSSWRVSMWIEGATRHVATCEDEDSAGLVADAARVAMGLAPKNFPALWDSIKARVEAGENCDVPAAVAPVVFRGSVRVDGVTIGVSEAVSSLEAKIEKAIAKKSDIAEKPLFGFGFSKEVRDGLDAEGCKSIGHLAGANVDDATLHAVVAPGSTTSYARVKLWKLKSKAAGRLGVDIGALPTKQPAAKTSTKKRPAKHQCVRGGVANRSITWLSG